MFAVWGVSQGEFGPRVPMALPTRYGLGLTSTRHNLPFLGLM